MNVKTNKPETLVLGLIAKSTPTTIGRLAAPSLWHCRVSGLFRHLSLRHRVC
jgi:hypothetical protein